MKCLCKFSTRRSRAMTLVEMLVGVGVGSIVLTIVALLAVFSARSFVAIGNYMDLDRISRNALDRMTKEIRECQQLTSFSTNQLVFNYAGTTNITYTYNRNARTLVRSKTGEADKVLLTGCDLWQVQRFQRNCMNGNNQFTNATTLDTSKLITITWVCSRNIGGKRILNTESIQTAQVVIRNQHKY